MKYTSKQYAKALWEVWEKKSPDKRTAILGSFIKLLKKQRAMKKLDFIIQELEKIYLIKNNLLKAGITAPFPPSKISLERIKKLVPHLFTAQQKGAGFISSFYKHRPDKIILEQKIDKNLIGGFQIKVNDYLIDGSVRNMLVKLKKTNL